jgi:hypothetical protein
MPTLKFKSGSLFLTAVILVCLFSPCVFASSGEFKVINELQKQERSVASPESSMNPQIEYNAEAENDPFQSPVAVTNKEAKQEEVGQPLQEIVEAVLPDVSVQGLIWGARFPQAIINNKVVKVGDKLDEISVVNIDKDGITLFFKGKEFVLPSPSSTNKLYKSP